VTTEHANWAIVAFTAVAAIAIILQTLILAGLSKAMREFATRMEGILGRVETQASPVLATAHAILDDAQPKLADITANLAESTAAVRLHVSDIGQATGEIVERARLQAARVDEFVSDTISKLEVTTDMVQHTVIGPVRRIHALVQAVSAGLGFFRANRARRKSGNHNSSDDDEEMFI
jgi:methyl-accepting chemotaxis protein